MTAYEDYHLGKLKDYEYPAEKVEEAMKHLPAVPAARPIASLGPHA